MSPSPNARSTSVFIAGIAIAVLLVAGVLAWLHWRSPVPTEDVTAYLDGTIGGGRVRFSDVKVDSLRRDESGLLIAVAANSTSVGPLYSKVDAAEYLRRTFQVDPATTANVRELLAAGTALGDRQLAGAGSIPTDPYQSTIIQQTSPGGAEFRFQGVIGAKRDGGKWSFTLESGGFEAGGPQGSARSAFPEGAFMAGDLNDDARLRGLANDYQAFANRVADIQRKSGSTGTNSPSVDRDAFLAALAPGRVFRGVAFEAGEQHGTVLYLEITAITQGNEVTARLRNEGSWHVSRAFQGTWDLDASGIPTLNLTSLPEQAVRNSGPYLENAQSWTFALQMDRQGSLSGQDGFFKYQFRSMSYDQAYELRLRLDGEYARSIAATGAGLLYIGTARSLDAGSSEPILLRFTSNSGDGAALTARIEATSHAWIRKLRGNIVSNSRRSGGEAIRLRSPSAEAAAEAPVESVLGVHDDMEIRLGLENGSLVGEDARFSYRFELANKGDLSRLDAEGAERARRFLNIVRKGVNLDGTLREEQGYIGHARLEVVSIDPRTNAISVRMHSLSQQTVHRDFVGTCDPAGDSITLTAMSRGVFNNGDGFDVPFFKGPNNAATLHLAVTANSIEGSIEGDSAWVLAFSTAVFLSAPVEGIEANSPPANGAVYPQFPKADGAYLLSGGSWLALPANQGHVATEAVTPKSDLQLPTNIADALQMGVDHLVKAKEAKKVPFLEFPGKDKRPESSAQATTILFIGPEPAGSPPVELASEETKKDGSRAVELTSAEPGTVRFAALRAPAFVRQVSPGVILLTTTSTLAPGPYAFDADHGYELIQD
jgi:hypothetical protein